MFEKVCEVCGERFSAKTKETKVCGKDSCRKELKNKSARDKRKKEKEDAEAFKSRGKNNSKPRLSIEEVLAIGKKHRMYRYGDIVAKIEAGVIG